MSHNYNDSKSLKINELKREISELKLILENLNNGICVFNKDGFLIEVNSAVYRLTGLKKSYTIGTHVNDFIRKKYIDESVVLAVLENKQEVTIMQSYPTGKECMVMGIPIIDDEGNIERIISIISDVTELKKLQDELLNIRKFNQFIENKKNYIIAESEEMKRVLELAFRFAKLDTTLLILGESGVGKELVAQLIYENSDRKEEGDFIKVNCAAIPEHLLESEFFGYEKGAFTGANSRGKQGVFELADRGILFLDEIGDLSLTLQGKVLRVLQEREFTRVGGTKPIQINTRIISATNRNLEQMVYNNEFRQDLYYRLNVLPLVIPPLRIRPSDIIALINKFLEKFNKQYATRKTFSPQAMQYLLNYNWPGNVRELANLVERTILVSHKDKIEPEDLPRSICGKKISEKEYRGKLKDAVENFERDIIKTTFEKYGNTYAAADALGISQPTFVRRVHKYKLNKNAP
ncbi:MAG: sigma 54-interacting transcriptional regulator [Deltaproteobacteria bacterium]|nr:sigma 54-interacting transcriptional regulator [Deltaproteobacteria bacterium]